MNKNTCNIDKNVLKLLSVGNFGRGEFWKKKYIFYIWG